MKKPAYSKRFYRRFSDFRRDTRAVAAQRKRVKALGSAGAISKVFRERLMLAVTQVNGCRYCAYAHAKVALAAGLTQADVQALAAGSFDGAPPEEIPALLYAQHWAEADASPDPEVRQAVLATYGEARLAAIELSLGAIRIGNLLGNTGDYALFRMSKGRWGAKR
jgi:AhpD family alkylhydroperoxidase